MACDEETSTDVVGCWNGITAEETFVFNQSAGLNETERELVANRAMARVEQLRDRPFKQDVPVDVLTRAEYRDMRADSGEADTSEFDRWNDQVWKALFVVGEDASAAQEIETVFGGAVAGFYSPGDNQVALVTDGPAEAAQIDETTLIHELGHAMQDQYHDLSHPRYTGDTRDADLAIDGIVEGEVVYLEDRFEKRCGAEWDCLEDPPGTESGGEELNNGILQLVLQPYFDGPVYAEQRYKNGGWAAIDDLMNDPPETTREVIHREPYSPPPMEVTDTATGGWERYENQGVDGADRVGEASVYVMLWYQALMYNAPTMSPQDHLDAPESYYDRFGYATAYHYVDPASSGWANDALYPYRNTETGDDGYVWVTEWETTADAKAFETAYTQILETHGNVTTPVTVLNDGPFRGAYGVHRDGTSVTIVHGPSESSIEALMPGLPAAIEDPAVETPVGDPVDVASPAEVPDAAVPGFGVVIAVISIVAAAWRRQSAS